MINISCTPGWIKTIGHQICNSSFEIIIDWFDWLVFEIYSILQSLYDAAADRQTSNYSKACFPKEKFTDFCVLLFLNYGSILAESVVFFHHFSKTECVVILHILLLHFDYLEMANQTCVAQM